MQRERSSSGSRITNRIKKARLLRMPPVVDVVYPNEKQPLQEIVSVSGAGSETRNMSLHEFTAWALP